MSTLGKFLVFSILFSQICYSKVNEDWNQEFINPPIKSPYTDALDSLYMNWNPEIWKKSPLKNVLSTHLGLYCYKNPQNKYAVGALQQVKIEASLESLQNILSRIESYQEFFPDYRKITVLKRLKDRILTFWEPVLPLGTMHYRLLYKIKEASGAHLYRYQMSWSNHSLKYSDGIIVIDADPSDKKKSRYFELDFFEPITGLGTFIVGPKRIRREGIRGLMISDRALQLKAENPHLSNAMIRETSKKTDFLRLEECLNSQIEFKPFW